MQIATIEFARNVSNCPRRTRPNSIRKTPNPVIAMLDEQKRVTRKKGGTMRLGAQPCQLVVGTKAAERFTARSSSTSATATATNSTTPIAKNLRRPALFSAAFARRQTGRSDRTARAIPFSWPASFIRNFRASRTSRIRFSKASSPPRTVSFRERIQVNRQLIPENELVRLVEEISTGSNNFPPTINLTLFEFATVMALKFFAEQKCDLVIWETGLGGRLDATNIVTPLASVITNIAFDHQQWLGDTLEKIAAEKAGIIKPGIPVVTATDESSALAVIEKIAREKNAPLKIVGGIGSRTKSGRSPRPHYVCLGEHQKINAALALATVEVLQKQIPVAAKKIREGLANVNWPGRLQLIEKPDGQKISARRRAQCRRRKSFTRRRWRKIFRRKERTLILGVLQDKDWREICELLAPLAEKIFVVPVASERSANPKELAEICRTANPAAEIFVCDSLSEAF
jgi:dihydrofolate synthase/folylpolyglutamate synthase